MKQQTLELEPETLGYLYGLCCKTASRLRTGKGPSIALAGADQAIKELRPYIDERAALVIHLMQDMLDRLERESSGAGDV